jgi:hypothetical protein
MEDVTAALLSVPNVLLKHLQNMTLVHNFLTVHLSQAINSTEMGRAIEDT